MGKLKLLFRMLIFNVLCPLAFDIFSKKKVNPRLIIFAYNGNYKKMPDNLQPLFDKLSEKGMKCMVFGNYTSRLKELLDAIRFQKYYAQSKCVFISDYFQPVYCHQPRNGSKVVQVWHACGAFKKWGLSTLDKSWGASKKDVNTFPMHNTYTLVSVSAEEVAGCYSEAFGCKKEVVKALGTPRTDVYFDKSFVEEQRKIIEKQIPQANGKKIILYAPTFRGNNLINSYMDNMLDIKKLKSALSDNYILLLKLHPLTAKGFELSDGEFVFDISKTNSIDTALCCADIVISDYSSLIFEYSLLTRPMIFFAYDLEEYDRDRSFYYDYRDFVPGKITVNTDEIIAEVIRLEDNFDAETVYNFRKKYMSACDGHSSERLADYAVSDN